MRLKGKESKGGHMTHFHKDIEKKYTKTKETREKHTERREFTNLVTSIMLESQMFTDITKSNFNNKRDKLKRQIGQECAKRGKSQID